MGPDLDLCSPAGAAGFACEGSQDRLQPEEEEDHAHVAMLARTGVLEWELLDCASGGYSKMLQQQNSEWSETPTAIMCNILGRLQFQLGKNTLGGLRALHWSFPLQPARSL